MISQGMGRRLNNQVSIARLLVSNQMISQGMGRDLGPFPAKALKTGFQSDDFPRYGKEVSEPFLCTLLYDGFQSDDFPRYGKGWRRWRFSGFERVSNQMISQGMGRPPSESAIAYPVLLVSNQMISQGMGRVPIVLFGGYPRQRFQSDDFPRYGKVETGVVNGEDTSEFPIR